MKKSILKTIPVLTVVSMILVPGLLPSVQAAGCKRDNLKGNYGYSEQGTISVGGNSMGLVEVGIISADGKGNLTGNGVLNISELFSGSINVSLNGAYTVDSTCIGTATFETTNSDTMGSLGLRHYALVLNQDGEIRLISKEVGESLVVVGRKVAAQ